MRVLVTGATGFVGRWLCRELEDAGHDPVAAPPSAQLSITDRAAVEALVAEVRPTAIAHLAAIAFAPDVARDVGRAFAVNVGGTMTVMETAAADRIPVLVVGSADVYGARLSEDLLIGETAPLATDRPYGLSKLAQERVAGAIANERGIPLAVVRPFNHTGPGQRMEFVVPALAGRIIAARRSGSDTIKAGNVDVFRDFTDVRDVVRAYRLVLEALDGPGLPGTARTFNVASGRSVSIRSIVGVLAQAAGFDVTITVDPTLVRSGDPPRVSGDASLLSATVGWAPTIPLEQTLRDVLADVEARSA